MSRKSIGLEEYQQVLRGILAYFDKICRANDIKYSLFSGSLLGAVRHQGIIPWDDDIDVILMPDEYQKLIKVLESQNPSNRYVLYRKENKRDYYYPFAKMIDTHTVVSEVGCKAIKGYGAFLDIFCFYYVPDNLRAARRVVRRTHFFHNVLAATNKTTQYKNPVYNLASQFFRLVGKDFWLKCFDRSLRAKNRGDKYVTTDWPSTGNPRCEILQSSSFKEYIDVDFDGQKVMITKDYDKVLTDVYGDYMTPPPANERQSNHSFKAFWK